SEGRYQDRGGLLRRDGTEPDLRPCFVRKNRLPRIDPSHLRSCENLLRPVARYLLAANRSYTSGRTVHRHRAQLSRRHFFRQRRGEKNSGGFKRKTRTLRKIQ